MKNITFNQVLEEEKKSLIYKPITKEQSLGKTVKEIKSFKTDNFMYSVISVIIFTDNTALFLNENQDCVTDFSCLTASYEDRQTGEIIVYIGQEGGDMIENGLCDEAILKESLKYIKAYRESQRDANKAKEIKALKEKLKALEE